MREVLKYGVLPFVLLVATCTLVCLALSVMNMPVSVALWFIGIAASIWASVFIYMRKMRNKDIPYYQPKDVPYYQQNRWGR